MSEGGYLFHSGYLPSQPPGGAVPLDRGGRPRPHAGRPARGPAAGEGARPTSLHRRGVPESSKYPPNAIPCGSRRKDARLTQDPTQIPLCNGLPTCRPRQPENVIVPSWLRSEFLLTTGDDVRAIRTFVGCHGAVGKGRCCEIGRAHVLN